jgi:hypothetical protein
LFSSYTLAASATQTSAPESSAMVDDHKTTFKPLIIASRHTVAIRNSNHSHIPVTEVVLPVPIPCLGKYTSRQCQAAL